MSAVFLAGGLLYAGTRNAGVACRAAVSVTAATRACSGWGWTHTVRTTCSSGRLSFLLHEPRDVDTLSESVPPVYVARSMSSVGSVVAKLKKHDVVPDVIQEASYKLLQVTYTGNVSVELGNELRPFQVSLKPDVSWNARPDTYYTLVMIDPDAPSRSDPSAAEWRHWLVVNIHGGDVSLGYHVTDYVGAGPPHNSGRYRYVFLLFLQPGRIEPDSSLIASKHKAVGRNNWSVSSFGKQHELGVPVAANFFQAEWDEYVPTLYEQFTEQ